MSEERAVNLKNKEMIVDIWSDIMCPFCYIGKRQFEAALASFAHKEKVEVIWHSYQLDPSIKYEEGKDVYTRLAEMKGKTREWSIKMHQSVVDMANKEGLDYDFSNAKIANSYDAHRVIQYAKTEGLGAAAEERFFRAYFMEGAVMSDHDTLIKLGVEIGLDKAGVSKVLSSDLFSKEVEQDILFAQRLGVNGVPFFLFDHKWAVSGAQGTPVFMKALNHTWKESNTAGVS
jgi:protein disulfide-isomerase